MVWPTLGSRTAKEQEQVVLGDKALYKSPQSLTGVCVCVQHYVTVLSSLVVFPLVVSSVLCVGHDWVAMSQIMSSILFVTGIATLLQCLVGCR